MELYFPSSQILVYQKSLEGLLNTDCQTLPQASYSVVGLG